MAGMVQADISSRKSESVQLPKNQEAENTRPSLAPRCQPQQWAIRRDWESKRPLKQSKKLRRTGAAVQRAKRCVEKYLCRNAGKCVRIPQRRMPGPALGRRAFLNQMRLAAR